VISMLIRRFAALFLRCLGRMSLFLVPVCWRPILPLFLTLCLMRLA
jgi:hypothetical protein